MLDSRPCLPSPVVARPPVLQELTYIIKQDISDLNTQIGQLQQITKSGSDGKSGGGKKKEAKQVEEHNSNVVVLLQSKLAEMGIGFKDVLEIRTQVLALVSFLDLKISY